VAQLHLAFSSPVSSIEGQNEWKFSGQVGEFHSLPVLIWQLKIGEALANGKIHRCTSGAPVARNLWI
jgi:hypothetical protein